MTEQAMTNNANLIWSVAEILRGDFKQSEYQKVVLPLTVLRRLDAVLTPKKAEFLDKAEKVKGMEGAETALESIARTTYGHTFYNTSPLDFEKLTDDADNVAGNLRSYIAGFSPDVRDVFLRFNFDPVITRLEVKGLLYKVIGRFAEADLHPDTITSTEMGYLYEQLIRKFSEMSGDTAGEHFTPREIIRLMVNLLITGDSEALTVPGRIVTLYDPAAGTGGMLSVGEDHILSFNPQANVATFGQEINDETYAVAKSDMMVKGDSAAGMVPGNSFTEDGHVGETFDYILANPPFGVDWGKYKEPIVDEHSKLGYDGRFGPGLPRKSDGSMLFLLHMMSKMKDPSDGGSRIGIIFNASPLFTGSPGGGESEIRRWVIENDMLEAIVALPEQMFYNTGIATYIWIVTNTKAAERRGTVQLIDAREMWAPMRKSLGDKRREFTDEHIEAITRLHDDYTDADPEQSKVFPNHHFGSQKVTVERPLRIEWVMDDETVDNVRAHKTFAKLGDVKKGEDPEAGSKRQQSVLDAFGDTGWGDTPFGVFNDIWNHYRYNLDQRDVDPNTQIRKMLLDASTRRNPDLEPQRTSKGVIEADTDLRDTETVPLPDRSDPWDADPTDRLATPDYRREVDQYIDTEVLPWVPDAWVDHSKTKLGYEIPFTREFYMYEPPRPLAEIDADIEQLEAEILRLLAEVMR